MVDEPKPATAPQAIEKKNGDGAAAAEQTVTPEYIPTAALEKLEKPELVQLVSFISSRTTVGPDPETAKLMARTEMHHETCRLDAYKENLKNQESESVRKHEFRMKRLNHETLLTALVFLVALAGAGTGLYLVINDKTGLGSNLLIASVALIYYIIGGKSPFHKKEE